jgi:type I restriction enzyme S subunit
MLGEITTIVGGGTPTRSNPDFYGGEIPWVTPKDMKSWEIHGAQVTITQSGLKNSATRVVPANSVLVVVRSGVLKHTVPVAVNRVPVAINQDMKALQCGDVLDPDFLARFLKARSSEILQWVRATTADNFPIDSLKKLRIPLPPLAEQRRIAEVLGRAEALRLKRRAALAQLDTLAQALFVELFGETGESPRRWPVRPVSDYVAEFQGGRSLEAETGENAVTRNRVLKVSAVTGMTFLAHESKPVPDSYQPPPEHFARAGDLLFSRANTMELVGAVAYVDTVPANVLLPDKLWRFVWREPVTVEPLFVWALFQTPVVRREIARRATGTSGSMKNISQEKVFGISTILPPLSFQQTFTRRITALERLKTVHRASLAELDALFAVLQHHAFRGEL